MRLVNKEVLGVVETMYRLDLSPEQWLGQVTAALRPIIDTDGLGIIAFPYECADPCSWVPGRALVHDVPFRLASAYFECVTRPPPGALANTVLSLGWWSIRRTLQWEDLPVGGLAIADKVTLNASNADGKGYVFGSFRKEFLRQSRGSDGMLTCISAHLSSANRLRRRFVGGSVPLAAADVILTSGGRVVHQTSKLGAKARDRLVRASRARDRMRVRRRKPDASNVVELWPAVVRHRWTLVDCFERDGRRFVLAVDNRPNPTAVDLLSDRERDAVRLALVGKENKVIAYEMGLAQSTVRVLIARAASKLGATSRMDLLEKARVLEEQGGLASSPQ